MHDDERHVVASARIQCGFEQHIRRTDKIDEMTFERKPITVYSPYSAAGYDYRAFVQEYIQPPVTMDEILRGGLW